MATPDPTALKTEPQPLPMGSPLEAYHQVLRRLAPHTPLEVLDCPAGEGALARMLRELEYAVWACDIVPENFRLEGVECLKGNLNETLPYPDARFDVVTSCNGVHRVFALGRAISEYTRILRPGGRLFVTVPNFGRLNRRVHFLLFGVVSRAYVRRAAESERPEALFRQPVTVPRLLTAMEAASLEVVHVGGFETHWRRVLGYFPLWGCIKLALLFASRSKKRKYHLREAATFSALFNDFLLVEARRPA